MLVTLTHEHLDEPIGPYASHDAVVLHPAESVGAVLETFRSRPLGERIVYFYVVDDDDRMVGVVPTRRLLAGALDARIEDVMIRSVVTLRHDATAREALELMLARHLLALPLVDESGRFAGTVDVTLFTESLHDVTERPTPRDIFQLIGVHLTRGVTPWRAFTDRFPWLLSNIAGGLVAAFLASLFEPLLEAVIILALFIPVVLALAESVSIQSVSLTVQSLHGARVDWRFLVSALRSELAVAAMLGLAAGSVVASAAWAWKSDALVALAIGGSIALSMVTACLLGVLLPVSLRWLKRDPKVAAGPVVLALADTATLLFYFTLSGALLPR